MNAPFVSGCAYGLYPAELEALHPRQRGSTLFAQIQRPWLWADTGPDLGRQARAALTDAALQPLRLAGSQGSVDGSTKLRVALADDAEVETVHIPRTVGTGRVTVCVSSQVGCALGCAFCATAQLGLTRQLTAAEMVLEVLVTLRELGPRHPSELTLVFMGMGEPLHNFTHLSRAIQVLCNPCGLGLSPRRITVSTAGLVPEIAALGKLPGRPLLAVSLNATTDDQRQALMPIGMRYPLAALRGALQAFPVQRGEHITVQYVLLAGVNDTDGDAQRLAEFAAPFPHNINLIPFNPHPGSPFRSPDERSVATFVQALLKHRPTLVTVRRSRGGDVGGACGQLVTTPKRAAPQRPQAGET